MLRQLPSQSEFIFRLLLEYEASRSQRYPNPIAILRIGSALTNPTLTEMEYAPTALAKILSTSLRQTDIAGQIGSGFVVMLPNTTPANARSVCERLMQATRGTHNATPGTATRVAICIGLATHEGGPKLNATNLMAEAEEALRQALATGPHTYHVFTDKVSRRV